MYDINSKSIVSTSEREALKELIFNRARERAEAMAKSAQEAYTTSFKNELMDIARDSFKSTSGNPFAPKAVNAANESEPQTEKTENIGFPERIVADNLKASIEYRTNQIKEAAAQDEVNRIMKDAGMDFSRKQSFMGALNFLNAQASLSLINKKSKGFEAIA